MPKPVEIPLSKVFSDERIKDIYGRAGKLLLSEVRSLRGIREDKVNKWRKVYNGTPREKTKSFPWQNASNVVIQLVGSFVDQLVAKIVMGSVAMDPLYDVDILGDFDREERAEEQRDSIQTWLPYRCLEPSQINYLPKAIIWTRTMVRYGFGAIKAIPEYQVEQVVSEDGTFSDYVRHNGPVAYPILFEDFLMPANTVELERSGLIAQRARLRRIDVEDLRRDRSYDQSAIAEILRSPTRYGPDKNAQQIENETGARTDMETPEWDLYEIYMPYVAVGKKFQLILSCFCDDSGENPKFVKGVFNWFPDNSLPYIGARLGSDGETAYGKGFCEMLKDYQEEVTAIHNRRGDASTLANTNLIRIDTGQQIDSQFSIFPNATIPAAKDAVEVIPLGRTANETIKDEQMTLQLATDRAGVGPSSSGQGAGTVNKKGSYSAMGTASVMQEGNTRANLNVTEFRVSHYCFGRLVLLYDSHFGISPRDIEALGKQGRHLTKALENVKSGRLSLPIRAATGSVNKEIEKQNLMLLLNNTRAHWQMVAQLLQQATSPMTASMPEYQDYLLNVILSSNVLMKKIARDFAIPDPSSILPEPIGIQDKVDAIGDQHRGQQLQQVMKQLMTQGGQPPNVQLPQQQAPGAPGMGTGEPTVTQ